MNTPPKFLILEDVETDAELVMDEVKSTFTTCSFKWVVNETDFIKELNTFKPDLVLTDYSLPTYNGMSALKYVLEQSPDTPVILVTGSINEETAVACMKAGAVDYVLKDKMGRLGLAVKTALENKDIIIDRKRVKKELVKSELYYRSILKYMHDEIVVISKDYIITDINNSVLNLTGNKRDNIIGQTCYKILHNFDSPCINYGIDCFLSKVINSGVSERYQRNSKTIGGKEIQLDVIISPLFDENKKITHVIESHRDITNFIEAQDDVKKLSAAVEQSPSPTLMLNLNQEIDYVNKKFISLSGYRKEELIGKNPKVLNIGNFPQSERDVLFRKVINGEIEKNTFCNLKKNGDQYWVSAILAPLENSAGEITGIIEIQEDITQRLKDQKQIEDDLKEKELLLQEIYHRVNNNMQIMISLLNMQVDRAVLDSEKNVLRMAQSRVGAISAIHNDIYQEHSFIAINFGNVTRHIFNTLCDSLLVMCGNIELKVEAEIPDFGLDMAQPCALIVNELISNSMRHAYPDGAGIVYVSLNIDESEELTLIVKDNGIGMPESLVPEKSDTTGFNLVYMLATGQLDGTVDINRNNGTTVTIKFKRIEDQKRY